jgi:hypothetical protein
VAAGPPARPLQRGQLGAGDVAVPGLADALRMAHQASVAIPAPIAEAAPALVPGPTAPTIPEGGCEFCPPADRVRANRTYWESSGRDSRLCARHFAPLARVRRK